MWHAGIVVEPAHVNRSTVINCQTRHDACAVRWRAVHSNVRQEMLTGIVGPGEIDVRVGSPVVPPNQIDGISATGNQVLPWRVGRMEARSRRVVIHSDVRPEHVVLAERPPRHQEHQRRCRQKSDNSLCHYRLNYLHVTPGARICQAQLPHRLCTGQALRPALDLPRQQG